MSNKQPKEEKKKREKKVIPKSDLLELDCEYIKIEGASTYSL